MKTLTICTVILLSSVLVSSALAEENYWTNPQQVGGVVNTEVNDVKPFISSDGLSLYFTRWTDHAGVYQAMRTSSSGSFTSIDEITGIGEGTFDPWVSPDNLRMYYSGPGWNINITQRASVNDEWPMGEGISELNSQGMVCSPTLTADELTIVFVGGDPRGDAHGADLYMATRQNIYSPFSNVIALSSINSEFAEIEPDISSDGLNLYFSITNIENAGTYYSTRDFIDAPFGSPELFLLNYGSLSMSSDRNSFYCTGNMTGNMDIYVSYYIPEPATVLLFGLGGLFLRRRKV